MKTTKYTLLLILSVLLISCEDYLDKVDDLEALDEIDIFTDINLAEQFLDGGYAFLITEVSAKSGSSDILSGMVMSGEGSPGRKNRFAPERLNSYQNGDYRFLMDLNPNSNGYAVPNFVYRYRESWKGIRTMNTFLENVNLINSSDQERINGMKGQAYFLRAFYYHLLTKRHGGLVYLTDNLDINGVLGRKRESYDSNLQNMLLDLEQAINLLPKDWKGDFTGRPTRGAAMALKSRVTLFAASPLANPTNDQKKWEDAAVAASDLINYSNDNGLYQLIDASEANDIDVDIDGADLFVSVPEKLLNYRSIFVGSTRSKTLPQEGIFMEHNDNILGSSSIVPLPRTFLTQAFDVVRGNFDPQAIGATVGLMDKFEMKNGLPIDQSDSGYNEQAPFVNRDPRFYNTILYHGVPWAITSKEPLNGTGIVDLATKNENGDVGLDIHNPNEALWKTRYVTGLRTRKWAPEGFALTSGATGTGTDIYANNLIFRMSEIYLNYAEAANEAYGATGSAPNQTLSALDAVNKIRNRVGMPNVHSRYSSNQSELRNRIRNERAVELCLEGFKYDDIRRWKTAHLPENKDIKFLDMQWIDGGPTLEFPTGFRYRYVSQPDKAITFDEKHYWWPVPSSEVEIAPEYEQTINW